MKSNRDIRRQAWRTLTGKWFFRLMLVGLALQTITMTVNGLISGIFRTLSITSATDYLEARLNAMQQGLDYALPTAKAYYWMFAGFGLQMFISYVFAAIATFGFMHALLRAHADNDERWFSSSFGGFARPLSVTALLFLQNLLIFLWSLLLFIPGIVALYRYRQAWFVKVEHENLSARDCLRESARMMRGFKGQAFLLDLSFIGWILLSALLLGIAAAIGSTAGLVGALLGFLSGLTGFYLLVRTVLGMAVSRVVFYRELLDGQNVTGDSTSHVADTPGGPTSS